MTPEIPPTPTSTLEVVAAPVASGGFGIGQQVTMIRDADMYLEADATSLLYSVVPMGLGAVVVAGPVESGGVTWYQIDADVYGAGWVDATLLQAGPSSDDSGPGPVALEQPSDIPTAETFPTEETGIPGEAVDNGIVSIQPIEDVTEVASDQEVFDTPTPADLVETTPSEETNAPVYVVPTEELPVDDSGVLPIEGIQPIDGSDTVVTDGTQPELVPTEDPFAIPPAQDAQPQVDEQPVDTGSSLEQPPGEQPSADQLPVEPTPTPGPLESVKIGLMAGPPDQQALVDGNPMTAWYTYDTVGIVEAEFTINLGAVQHISLVKWQPGLGEFSGNMYLQVSADGVNWDEMPLDFSEVDGPWTLFRFDRDVQYVRFVFRNDDAASLPQLGGLSEVEIWP